MKYKVGDKVRIKDIDIVGTVESIIRGQLIVNYKGSKIPVWPEDVVLMESVEEEIKPKFKVGDKITNGEITFTILRLSSDRYGAEDTFGECGSVCFKSQDEWKIVEEEVDLIPMFGEYSDNEPLDIPTMTTDFVKEYGLPCPDDYQFKDENGNVINATKIVLEKKKKEYPKTYAECSDILAVYTDPDIDGYKGELLWTFQKLLVCRDAYWQIAGEKMGLGEPWVPDWNTSEPKYVIACTSNGIEKQWETTYCKVFAFPTAEMRDAFCENFKEEIEICKELL